MKNPSELPQIAVRKETLFNKV